MASNWNCKDLPVSEGVSYKAHCNFDKSVTLKKIRINYANETFRLGGYEDVYNSKNLCSMLGLSMGHSTSGEYLFKRKIVNLGRNNNVVFVSEIVKSRYYLKSVTCF